MIRQKILITGGLGFIGSAIADRLKKENHEVLIVDNHSNVKKNPASKQSKTDFVQCDIRDSKKIDAIVATFRPDVISHHAAHISVSESIKDPLMDFSVNVEGTLNLLEVTKKYKVKQFIFASSGGAVYGNLSDKKRSFRETDPSIPQVPYGFSKFTAEQYVQFYGKTYGVSTCILRYANVYGPGQFHSATPGVIVKFIVQAIHQGEIEIWGDGSHSRDYVFVDDVVEANLAVLKYRPESIFNIGSTTRKTTLEVAQLVQKIVGREVAITYKKLASLEVEKSCLNSDKAGSELRWQAETTLIIGVKKTYKQIRDYLDSQKR